MSDRRLRALIDQQLVGELSDTDGWWRFAYAADWLAHPAAFALSPHLPLQAEPISDTSTHRQVQWYFDNLLPEEDQRRQLARDAGIRWEDAFGMLASYGAESAGSLTLLPVDAPPDAIGGLRPLPDAALSERIRAMPKVSLASGAIKRMSLAGAQHKLAVVLDGDALHEPIGSTASTYILKPDHSGDDYPHSVANEWFVMRLARQMQLNAPRVLRRYVPEPVYLIERFDRRREGDITRRLHAIDGCQLLGLDKFYKYEAGSIDKLDTVARACRAPALARLELFKWTVFNALVGNSDAHLKNLSFLVSTEGIQLSPIYDLVSVAVYDSQAFSDSRWPVETPLAWPLMGRRRFSELDQAALMEAAGAMRIGKATALRVSSKMVAQIETEADQLLDQIARENETLAQQHLGLLSARLAGEMRCLRAIRFTIIAEMVRKLSS
ncbi:MAG: HipA domain-containing protein [Pseudomonadota bacterium]